MFNIETVLRANRPDIRFPFHKYKTENWKVEYVCSQADKKISKNKRNEWVNDLLLYFARTTDINEVESFIESLNKKDEAEYEIQNICSSLIKLTKVDAIEDAQFEDIFNRVRKYLKEDQLLAKTPDISNLAFLNSATSTTYENSFFPIKREKIIGTDFEGVYVPIATKNLFLKYYTRKLGNETHWDIMDAEYYLDVIGGILMDFLRQKA
ncbi:MAG: hypothetical protein U5L09_01785 [Bacteroidales bacterium]|nr:hypothetical protein [Bacteroidales bacterium]